ncbi:hypothetical protein BCR41DRAFT_356802 [Lobosporangium transversale]|uniref:Homeodomain-like protein n=1 Tax=Lobosporangium transversale TaxID=64571 RepID=A0A1Y2GIU3_9FUNG|nr:hypothetical protein BCR41DRAFT_357300 [Lobosporangium transversale]XP_021879808.1 hypothetical protein BCR41DRAFT_356802 [Lobosporangium transversale]ORZ10984.1 hypothetical protein BCR41DRAFT_357300 [Lobosporangium transversale]ORZ11711.1 hypothetical protein BCR41DRAFT_356802 [Lobosporangium transversale]|eukprot:XP_021879501.1 hypothetical protein BCR41DRAFT_357300 [Lobosporangium transversale]
MAVNMSDSYSSHSDFEPYSHFAYQASSQFDVPAVVFNAALPQDMPSLGLTGEEEPNIEDLLNLEEAAAPRKRDRGERIVWTPEEDEFLRAAVQKYGDKTEKWAKIAACVPGRTNKNCRKRWFHSLDPKLKKGPWTPEEDHLLRTGVEMFKGQWSKIAERIPGRTDDQCAKRWREGLDPHIDRAAWTPEDDLILLQRFEEFGSQWQKIALAFPGRPGINHMKRVNKKRGQGSSNDAAILAETRRLEALLDTHNDDFESDANYHVNSDDILLMRDSFFDEEFLEHGITLDDDSFAKLASDIKGDQADNSEPEDDTKPYGCAILDCNFMSSSPSLLYYHIKASHAGTTVEKPFRCTMPGCEMRKRYKNINGLQYHVTHAKNSPGHTGHSNTIEDTSESSSKAIRTARQSTPNSHNKLNTSTSSAPSPSLGLRMPIPSTVFETSMMGLPNSPTPTEVHLQLHQSSQKDHPPQTLFQHIAHNALNIPHSASSLEGSAASSQTSSGASSPKNHRTLLHCPELGCEQSYHQIQGLNTHITNSHGHRAMTMHSDDTIFRTDAMVIPQNSHTDLDIDMIDLTSAASSPLDSNLLLQHQVASNGDHMVIDAMSAPNNVQDISNSTDGNNGSNTTDNNADFDIFGGKELFFANPMGNPLHDRIHFGTHINVAAHEPIFVQPMSITTTTATDAGASNLNSATNSSILSLTTSALLATVPAFSTPASVLPATFTSKVTKAPASRSSTKKFACAAPACQKSYVSQSSLNNHMRNDHIDLYSSISASKASSSGSVTASVRRLPTASMELPNTSDYSKEEDESNKPYKCLVPGCGKGYTNINGLKNHLLQTHGSTPKTSTAA